MSKICFLLSLGLIFSGSLGAQAGKNLNLNEAIGQAQRQSPSYSRAINRAENRYWNYRQFRASFLPQLNFSGTLPNYSSAIEGILQNDGTIDFREREQLFTSSQLSLDQNISFTGGRLSLASGLQRTEVRRPTERTSFFSTPVSVSYFQPMLLYNALKWDQKIEPLAFQESKRQYQEDLEQIATETTNLYFEALIASVSQKIAAANVDNNDTIYKISKGRYNLGKIAENDLLQIELNLLNAESSLTQANLQYEVATQNLKRFLGINTNTPLNLEIPSVVPKITIAITDALEKARNNRAAVLEFRRRRLEADESVARARGNTNYNLNFQANFGLSQQGTDFNQVYQPPLSSQQNIVVGVNIPLVDWGQAKSQIRRAKANRKLEQVNIEQDEINFEQEIFLQVMQFNAQYQQLAIAAKADTVAQKRYEVAKQRYLTGKIDITNFNIAQAEKDQAKRSYLSALRLFWNNYYTVRRLTLYDFVNQNALQYQADYER
jgi:outer membrane protein TolC